jgi:hypothetical protein
VIYSVINLKSLIKSCLIIGLLVGCSGEAIAKPRKQKICSYPVEAFSDTYKTYVYKKFGISIEMPDNLVSMGVSDGSIDITDRGTYKLLQCPKQYRVGRGYAGYRISWANDTIYDKSFNIKENVDLYVKKEGSYDYPTYLVILRLTNSKGQFIDVNIIDEGPIVEGNLRDYVRMYLKLGKRIEFVD